MSANPAWNRRADGPFDDTEAMDTDAERERIISDEKECAAFGCRMLTEHCATLFELLTDCYTREQAHKVLDDLLLKSASALTELAAENIRAAREYRREAMENR